VHGVKIADQLLAGGAGHGEGTECCCCQKSGSVSVLIYLLGTPEKVAPLGPTKTPVAIQFE
jgi:hypothetical protein